MKSKFKIFIILAVIAVFLLSTFYFLLSTIYAATNIDSTYRWAWNDVIGWIDFYNTNNVNVYSSRLEGYASSSVGYIALNCNSTPNGDICGGAAGDWKVSNNGSGYLSGWAYNDGIGWISFCGNSSGGSTYVGGTWQCPVSPTYQVIISQPNGEFSGWAWNDIVGWFSFNCYDTNTCPPLGPSDYKVKTAWTSQPVTGNLTSSIFDTQIIGGSAINAIIWQGSLNGGQVKFQIASSNCSNGAINPPICDSGTWSYFGPDGSDTTYYQPIGPGIAAKINLGYHNNQRYFRYKAILESDVSQTASPKVDDIIINYSP